MMPFLKSRRRFLAKTGGALFGSAFLGYFPAGKEDRRPKRTAPNDRIGIGIIGVGDLGRHHHLNILKGMSEFEILAVADVDQRHVDDAVKMTDGKATGYRDYRKLLERKDISCVLIATPDHWHALNTIHACEAGKDVYCEKPLTLTIAEGRDMVNAARRYGRIVQTGTQQRSGSQFRQACELVQNGRIGKITKVRCVLGGAPTAKRTPGGEPPKELDWSFWLGPTPMVPYHENRCHYNFRWFDDYSGGKLTDWGAHHIDIAQWGLGMQHSGPVKVRGTGTFPEDNLYTVPVDFDVIYTYASGTDLLVTSKGENGITFTGDSGEIFVSRETIRASTPELLEESSALRKIRLPVSTDHHRNWLDCIRSRELPIADVEIGHRSATVCHLGNIAIKTGVTLEWSPERESFVSADGADTSRLDRFRSRPRRAPWSL